MKAVQVEIVCALAREYLASHASRAPQLPIPALLIAGDFNSTPSTQPGFLPEVQRSELPEPFPSEWCRSAVYSLLETGKVQPSHPEHPDSFGKSRYAAAGELLPAKDFAVGGGIAGPTTDGNRIDKIN